MSRLLRALAVILLIGGITVCVLATRAAVTDEAYFRAAEALERHSDHILFQAEYQAALARHVAYLVAAILSGLGGIVGGAVLFGLAAILARVRRLEAFAAR
jgi:hypothetical protein